MIYREPGFPEFATESFRENLKDAQIFGLSSKIYIFSDNKISCIFFSAQGCYLLYVCVENRKDDNTKGKGTGSFGAKTPLHDEITS
jgi:hypothetical protein